MTMESDGVLSLVLVDPDGGSLPAWQPGAHIDLATPSGPRQYSLCGDPADRSRYRIGVLREVVSRGGSEWVHTELRPGQRVRTSGPLNQFRLVPAADYLFIAGGIGITPLLPMIHAVRGGGAQWRLLYGGRQRGSMAFLSELDGDRVTIWPEDECGLLDLASALTEAPNAVVYCCGPEPLLVAVEKLCGGSELHVERFAAAPVAAEEVAARGPAAPFEIELIRSQMVLTVPADRTIIEVCEAAGVMPNSSCREGTCGTCETKVLGGLPEHRDSILDEEDRASGETMMICVGRSRTPRLVLDL